MPGKAHHNSRIKSCLGCMLGALRIVLCTKKLHFVRWKRRCENYSYVACGFSPIKIDHSDYPQSFISSINEDYVFLWL